MIKLNSINLSGFDCLPLIEGGKGIAVSDGTSSGHWSKAGGVGTFSGVNADFTDENGDIVPQVYHSKTRSERHEELIQYGIKGGIYQAQVAHEITGGNSPLHMNILWEMGGAERILHGILEGARGLIHGVTCGAGMPYKLADIAAQYNIFYYPIVSSARAFRALWKRSYAKVAEKMGAVVYEDPWKAGGHNGLSNAEDPEVAQDPYPRVVALRKMMDECGVSRDVPIVMAGGVWHLKDWADWLDNEDVGPIAFQFGTRPLLTEESPISDAWKKKLLTLKEGDVFLNKFSPTGFYSSAVNNNFIQELRGRSDRQIPFSAEPVGELSEELTYGPRNRIIYVSPTDRLHAQDWMKQGFTECLKTPDKTMIFVTPEKMREIRKDQIDCMGCLSHCQFSNWCDDPGRDHTTGHAADPRSFCIQKTLQNAIHETDIDNQLMFSGHNAYRFAQDPFYSNGFVPTVKQLVDRIATGE